MAMLAWVLSLKVLELQSDDLLRCACQPAELPLRQQRVEGMVVSAQQGVQAALSGFLTAGCPPQEQLIPQLAGVARSAAELQQQCAILLLLAAPDPLAALDDLPAAGAAPDAAQAAHGAAAAAPPAADAAAVAAAPALPQPPAFLAAPLPEPPACPAALLPEHQQAWLQAAAAAAPAGQDVLPAAAELGALPAPIAEPAQPPELPAAAAPAPVPAPGICQAAPLASPFPATAGEAVAVTTTEAAAGRQQEQDAAAAAAAEQQPGGAAGTEPMQPGSDDAEAMQPALPLAPLQPQQPRPASRGQAAPAAAAAAAKPCLTSVSEVLRFMDSVPKHSRSPLLMDRLKARSPHESAHAALETIEEEGPVLSAQQVVPQAGQQLLGGSASDEQHPGQSGGGGGGNGGAPAPTGGRSSLQALLADFGRKLHIGRRKPTVSAEVSGANYPVCRPDTRLPPRLLCAV